MKIDLHYGMDPSFGPDTHEGVGIGGTENFVIYASEYLARAGHEVCVYNKIVKPTWKAYSVPDLSPETGVMWYPLSHFDPDEARDVLVSFRAREVFEDFMALGSTKLTVLILADTESYGLGELVKAGAVDLVTFVSQWQADKISREENLLPKNTMVSSNGVAMELFDAERRQIGRIRGKCIHLGTPERGLEPLLDIWPEIQHRVPHAELHLFSSFLGWRTTEAENEEMCKDIYARIAQMVAGGAQIVNHKHAPAPTIRRHLLESQLYLYPTRYFDETCCISALEASAAGVPILATKRAALAERVKSGLTGYLFWERERHDKLFAEMAIKLLYNLPAWEKMSQASVAMARRYDYAVVVRDWLERWERELTQ